MTELAKNTFKMNLELICPEIHSTPGRGVTFIKEIDEDQVPPEVMELFTDLTCTETHGDALAELDQMFNTRGMPLNIMDYDN